MRRAYGSGSRMRHTAIAGDANGTRKAYWYYGSECELDVKMAQDLYETFIIETNTAALVSTDTRWWQERQREIDSEKAAAK